ncbi:S-methyl-5'-thioadenosine phosphorylase [Nocardia puris]|uniref:S-methyl-5'-thioadenosine phosphorylase n=1 Tax=Nocardia puris TaxID=208602 RepID=A0A366DFN1_9NOCA|nr:S-methyl-5'-thioadenosine phosphorylase [Nocardia puris]MBF6212520.1 S-methyl-5'-thioadenosine phosphorylase [Nocardia puris]MBF6366767.1 S-methyl-5'-thioadenosine phosphorylase [Nocardia puris]MBF6461109.1 S-methyl-5'-thioadenosine phosphorylase [Nocardia puris]RBO88880.1 methylthioadenosine phosphorylase [Nocardia puris]
MSSLPRPALAVIGGSGFYDFFDNDATTVEVDTPYGKPSAPIAVGEVEGRPVAFVPRHGKQHEFAPHTLPYRANLWALRSLGVRRVLAPCAVGSLRADWGPGTVAVPDQLVDRTSGREQTYFDGGGVHVSFADPYCDELRSAVVKSEIEALPLKAGGTMVVVQGPRFSTRAESRWFAGQGWDLVNMTGHPEAVLARELELCYAAVALVTDLDAGLEEGDGVHAVDVFAEFKRNLAPFKELIRASVAAVSGTDTCDRCRVHTGVSLPFALP